jgi:hypothetical protein
LGFACIKLLFCNRIPTRRPRIIHHYKWMLAHALIFLRLQRFHLNSLILILISLSSFICKFHTPYNHYTLLPYPIKWYIRIILFKFYFIAFIFIAYILICTLPATYIIFHIYVVAWFINDARIFLFYFGFVIASIKFQDVFIHNK